MSRLVTVVRWGAAALAVARIARAGRRVAPLAPVPEARDGGTARDGATVSVIVPARDEAARIGPCLLALRDDPHVHEVIVVDDESSDATATVARSHGARVITGAPLPAGWVGKPWALQQGLEAATGDWVVLLDADTRPRRAIVAALVERAARDRIDLLSAGVRFRCPGAGQQWLHASMLTTLVYRFGPAGAARVPVARRAIANGQCLVARREPLLAAGGFAAVRDHLTDDIALVRHLRARGWTCALLDGADVVTVEMHDSAADVWRSWGRSLPMADVTGPLDQAADLAVVWCAQALPAARLLTGRADGLDLLLVAMRLGTLVGTARTYERPGLGYWTSPLADVAVAARLTWGALRPGRTWRGRTYSARPRAGRPRSASAA